MTMTNSQVAQPKLQINTRQLAGGSILIMAGGAVALAGITMAGAALVTAYRNRAQAMDIPPSALARHHLNRVRQATAAGIAEYRNGREPAPATAG